MDTTKTRTRRNMKTFIYLRVSTDDKGQDPELQLKDCQNLAEQAYPRADIKVFREEGSAWSDKARPVFDQAVKDAIAEKVEAFIVWDLDRLYRNRVKMVSFVKEMSRVKIKVISTRQKWLEQLHSIPYPWNEIVFDLVINILGWMAEEESQKKSDRVKLAVTKKYGHTVSKAGKRWGRPTISDYLKAEVRRLKEEGKSIVGIAKEKGLSENTVRKILRTPSKKVEVQNAQN